MKIIGKENNMAEEQRKYYKPSEAAKILGLSTAKVRDMCHIKNQRFAFRTIKNGRKGHFLIDLEKIKNYIERPSEDSRIMYSFNQQLGKGRKYG
ncbi:MAG: helix-turn-helix domain-containing protein [Lachnospiraceae bacterium]|nr:helix-turn-helix domain-containing protein [Lachnospiraceae bacterium]